MGATFLSTPVEVTPSTKDAWTDVNVSAYVPAGSSGIIFEIVNKDDDDSEQASVRKNGSTDNRTHKLAAEVHWWGCIGVDSSRIFEAYIGSTTDIDIFLHGYFDSDAVFFTNAVDKSLSATGAWTDIDISTDTGADTAVGAIFERSSSSTGYDYGFRKNGSTDSRVTRHDRICHALVGVDGSEICEGRITNTNVDFYLVGYFKAGVTFNTNASDRSLSSTGSYIDLTALPAGAIGGIYEVSSSSSTVKYHLRRNGNTDSRYYGGRHVWAIVACDTNRVVEGKIASTSLDFFEVGYFTSAVALTVPVGSLTITGYAPEVTVFDPTWTITINSVDRTTSTSAEHAVTIEQTLNGRDTCKLSVNDLRPSIGQAIVIANGSIKRFAGLITGIDEDGENKGGLPAENVIYRSHITATDYNQYADRRLVKRTYDNQTLKAIAQDLVTTYLATFGVTLSSNVVDGPTLPAISWDYKRLDACLNELSDLTGYVWTINYDKVLELSMPSTGLAAPFSITDAAPHCASITTSGGRTEYRNRQYVRFGSEVPLIKEESFTSDGSQTTYVTTYAAADPPPTAVDVDGTTYKVGVSELDNTDWLWDRTTHTLTNGGTVLASGVVVTLAYTAAFPMTINVDDTAAITADGEHEHLIEAKDVFDYDQAVELGTGLIRRYASVPTRVAIECDSQDDQAMLGRLRPGQMLPITFTPRNLASNYLIETVSLTAEPATTQRWLYSLTCVEGTEYQGRWTDFFDRISAPAAAGGALSTSAPWAVPSLGPTVLFLGGSRVEAIRIDTAGTWQEIPEVIEVELESSLFVNRNVFVRCEIWARNSSISVTARFQQITDSVTVGTSTAVTSTTPTEVRFPVTLTTGTRTYRIELDSNTSAEDVFCYNSVLGTSA